jgi:hypothetical protein
MIYADLLNDLSHLTVLIVALVVLILAVIFRSEIKDLSRRLSKVQAKGVTLEARESTLDSDANADSSEQEIEPAPPSGEENHPPDPSEPPLESETPESKDDEFAIRGKMYQARLDGDKGEADRLLDRLKALQDDPAARKKDEALYYSAGFSGNTDPDALSKLEALAEDVEVANFANRMLGVAYLRAGMSSQAVESFQAAWDAAANSYEKVLAAVGKADAMAALGEPRQAAAELEDLLSADSSREEKLAIWSALDGLYRKADDKLSVALAAHQLARLAVSSSNKWVNAGYAYGQVTDPPLPLLALHCYVTSLKFGGKKAVANNNLGAALSGLGAPITGTRFYKEASDEGNSLARANLGKKYLDVGFEDEAKKVLESAAAQPDPHPNVSSHLALIPKRNETEEELVGSLTAAGERLANFVPEFIGARLSARAPLIEGEWIVEPAGTGTATVGVESGKLSISWKDEDDFLEMKHHFSAPLEGRAASGKLKKEESFSSGAMKPDGSALAVVAEDGRSIRLMRDGAADGNEAFSFAVKDAAGIGRSA